MSPSQSLTVEVLFTWAPNTPPSAIPSQVLKAIVSSPTWYDYENGLISRQDCLDRITQQFSISPSRAQLAFDNSCIAGPAQRGRVYLQQNAGRLDSVTNNGVVLKENFAQLLILEATGDRNLVRLIEHPTKWNFFQGKPCLTTQEFPCDLDTTSLALTVTTRPKSIISSVMDEMLECVNQEGIVQTYFDATRRRTDPVVCVNVLSLFYSNDRGHQLPQTFAWVKHVLITRAYTNGTRYYSTGECFLFFLARFLNRIKGTPAAIELQPLLLQRVTERIGTSGDALALAMRVLTCAFVGVSDDTDLATLLTMQQQDGGWENGWVYKYGSSGISIGNRGLVTALAVNAIASVQTLQTPVATDRIGSVIAERNVGRHRRSRSYGDEISSAMRKHLHLPWFRASPQ